ncbi:MAG: alpha/beta fold hydrolase [Steroidobacteraceae bacterium]|jgi:pimeloyl-ACP methyl ester carboxylesterase
MIGKILKKLLQWSLGTLGFILLLGLVLGLTAAWVYRDVPAAEVEARWATEPSRFLHIDGVRLHYRDEGEGPIVVLLHANYSSLFMWEPWVKALRENYRVVRVDLPAHGLTGPEPNGNYTLERIQYLVEAFIDARGLDRFTLVGTSIGGTVAMRYAAEHPRRVDRLVLISPGSLEQRVRGQTRGADIPTVANAIAYVAPPAFTRFMLENDYGDRDKVTDAVVDEWHSMWSREGNRLAMIELLRQYVSGGVEQKIRSVKVPVLLIWGEKNKRVPLRLAYETRNLLIDSPEVRLEVLPGIGHMLVQEAPLQSAAVIRRYLDEFKEKETARISASASP